MIYIYLNAGNVSRTLADWALRLFLMHGVIEGSLRVVGQPSLLQYVCCIDALLMMITVKTYHIYW